MPAPLRCSSSVATPGRWPRSLQQRDDFPGDVADALAALASADRSAYIRAVESVLESFEAREEYLEDIAVADTVLVLQALAARRELTAELVSPLLPTPS